jgi:xylose isomerase
VGVEDIVYAHVLGMDALARGLRNAAALKQSGLLDELVADRYASWHAKGGLGEKVTKGKVRRSVLVVACRAGKLRDVVKVTPSS